MNFSFNAKFKEVVVVVVVCVLSLVSGYWLFLFFLDFVFSDCVVLLRHNNK